MSDANNIRKLRHVRAVLGDPASDRRKFYFDDVRLVHRALPEVDLAKIDSSIRFLGKRLSFPLLISSMTGGDHPELRRINRNLALAAEATGVALAVGSQRVMFTRAAARRSFELREVAPSALLFANLGDPHCPRCGQPIASQSVDRILDLARQFPGDERINVLAPLGMALLGVRVGEEVEWDMPSGVRRLRIEQVLFQPEAIEKAGGKR